jgi:hypothetical protein
LSVYLETDLLNEGGKNILRQKEDVEEVAESLYRKDVGAIGTQVQNSRTYRHLNVYI